MEYLNKKQIKELVNELLSFINLQNAMYILSNIKDNKKNIKDLLLINDYTEDVFYNKEEIERYNNLYNTYITLLEYGAIEVDNNKYIEITKIGIELYKEIILINNISKYSLSFIN